MLPMGQLRIPQKPVYRTRRRGTLSEREEILECLGQLQTLHISSTENGHAKFALFTNSRSFAAPESDAQTPAFARDNAAHHELANAFVDGCADSGGQVE